MKTIYVVKFGGTSISKLGHLGVLQRLDSEFPRSKVICVLSAEENVTNTLIGEFREEIRATAKDIGVDAESVDESRFGLEYDLHVSYGEIKSVWKASIAAKLLGKSAVPLTAWQARIRSSENHRHAVITGIDADHLRSLLLKNDFLFVAGFQGVSPLENITTLGRGASDLTAVAIAATLNVDKVHIYTDVDGIFTIDPRLLPDSSLIRNISYDEALELSSYGNKVIHERAVSLAQKYCTDIVIRNSVPTSSCETRITSAHSLSLDKNSARPITGIAVRSEIALFTVSIRNRPGKANALYDRLLGSSIPIPSVAQGFAESLSTIALAVDKPFGRDCQRLLSALKRERVLQRFSMRDDVSEVSLVGRQLTGLCGFLSRVHRLLEAEHIKPLLMSTSGIRVTLVLPSSLLQNALEALHKEFFNETHDST